VNLTPRKSIDGIHRRDYSLNHTAALSDLSPVTNFKFTTNMAAAIKALNAKIRANPVADYFCSTRKRNQTGACSRFQ